MFNFEMVALIGFCFSFGMAASWSHKIKMLGGLFGMLSVPFLAYEPMQEKQWVYLIVTVILSIQCWRFFYINYKEVIRYEKIGRG